MQVATHGTTRIAHLSDVHMLQSGPSRARSSYGLGHHFLSFGRALDAQTRDKKFRRGLGAARRAGAHHFVISGDLTEIGAPEEFESFAEALHDSGIEPERITLVPGNHDAYTTPTAWRWALEGPLRAFREGSADAPGKVVERKGVTFLPVDVTCHQPITRSAGELTAATADALEKRLADRAIVRQPVVLVQHHPPFSHASRAWQWVDGLRGWKRMMDMLVRFPDVHVLHGHLHHVVDKIVGHFEHAAGGASRIFGAPATVEDHIAAARVRLYDVREGKVESLGILEG
jgi:Icc protein